MSRLTRFVRTRPYQLAALLLLVILLLLMGLWWLRNARNAPSSVQIQNQQATQALEQQLEHIELLARLEALRADIQAERDPEELERRLARIRNDMDLINQGRDRATRQELRATLDGLSLELSGGSATVLQTFDSLMELLGAPPRNAGRAP